MEKLQGLGFQIEMDDFGTGYSSLNMLSSLPIDALKLDMQFIRSAFSSGGNTHMLEVIIGMSDYLSVPVIAEGVETEEQLRALKRWAATSCRAISSPSPFRPRNLSPLSCRRKKRIWRRAEQKAGGQREPRDGSEAEETPS